MRDFQFSWRANVGAYPAKARTIYLCIRNTSVGYFAKIYPIVIGLLGRQINLPPASRWIKLQV
ncbi:hypothetical protein SU32_14175 [Ahrensia marina]|uniref:Uncharacterized protein n=1 Tax=Ahrensia marina TaxID=1514904 RepID=A0A0M9GLP3_9HYPH|nr:hypothetical protein SU32_14175 [Ahrensia marina]